VIRTKYLNLKLLLEKFDIYLHKMNDRILRNDVTLLKSLNQHRSFCTSPDIQLLSSVHHQVAGGGSAMNCTKLRQTSASFPDNLISARNYRETPGITESLTGCCMSAFSLIVVQFDISSVSSPLIPPSCSDVQMYVYFKHCFFVPAGIMGLYLEIWSP
jgi:hypothetical protein